MKGTILGITLALSAGLMMSSGAASATPPPGPCENGQQIQVSTGIWAYVVYQCFNNEWHYMWECNEDGYCFISPPV